MATTFRRAYPPLLATLLIAGVWSCGRDKAMWSEAHDFSGHQWKPGEMVVFQPDSGYFDSIHPPVGLISLRYGRGCPVSRFPIAVEAESPATGEVSHDTVFLDLLPGHLRNGDRSTLGVFESVDTLRLSPPPADGWTLTLTSLADTVVSSTYSLTLQIIN